MLFVPADCRSHVPVGIYLPCTKYITVLYWVKCDNVKVTKIESNNFCNLNTVYMLFYKKAHHGNI